MSRRDRAMSSHSIMFMLVRTKILVAWLCAACTAAQPLDTVKPWRVRETKINTTFAEGDLLFRKADPHGVYIELWDSTCQYDTNPDRIAVDLKVHSCRCQVLWRRPPSVPCSADGTQESHSTSAFRMDTRQNASPLRHHGRSHGRLTSTTQGMAARRTLGSDSPKPLWTGTIGQHVSSQCQRLTGRHTRVRMGTARHAFTSTYTPQRARSLAHCL